MFFLLEFYFMSSSLLLGNHASETGCTLQINEPQLQRCKQQRATHQRLSTSTVNGWSSEHSGCTKSSADQLLYTSMKTSFLSKATEECPPEFRLLYLFNWFLVFEVLLTSLKSDILIPLVSIMKLRVKTTFKSWYIIIIYAKFSKKIILNRDLCGVFLELQAKKTYNYSSMEQNKWYMVFLSTMVDVESRWSAEHF